MTILVVDDDADQRQLRAMLLSRNGFHTVEAGDKEGAKLLAHAHHPAIAIVDLRLPTVSDGLEVVRALKSFDSQIRVIVLTGTSRQKVNNLPGVDLIDQLLIKPISTPKLIQTLRSFVQPK